MMDVMMISVSGEFGSLRDWRRRSSPDNVRLSDLDSGLQIPISEILTVYVVFLEGHDM